MTYILNLSLTMKRDLLMKINLTFSIQTLSITEVYLNLRVQLGILTSSQ